MTFKTNLLTDVDDQPIVVDFNYIPMRRGHCDKYGAPEEPDEPAEVEIMSVTGEDGIEFDNLNDEQLERIEKLCWEELKKREAECEPPEPSDLDNIPY